MLALLRITRQRLRQRIGIFPTSVAFSRIAFGCAISCVLISSYFSYMRSNPPIVLADDRLPAILDGKKSKKDIKKPPQTVFSCAFAHQGPRPAMEDEFIDSIEDGFFAVFDGHGGKAVSRYLRERLLVEYQEALKRRIAEGKSKHDSISLALEEALEKVQNLVLANSHWSRQGSTAVVCVVFEGYVWTANVGDSRAVLCRDETAVALSEDHKPNSTSELQRIKALGGEVSWHGWRRVDGSPMPGYGAYRMNGNLALSRAIGDAYERPFVSSKPDVTCVKLGPEPGIATDEEEESDITTGVDAFIVLASDGLWDVFSSQAAVDHVVTALKAEEAQMDVRGIRNSNVYRKTARLLGEEALQKGTYDNVSVIVVWLR